MNVYFACVVMRQTVGGSAARGVREERIVLVHAGDEEEAARKAEAFARATEYDAVNGDGEPIADRFAAVRDIQPFAGDELRDGSEVYYRLIWADEDANESDAATPPPASG